MSVNNKTKIDKIYSIKAVCNFLDLSRARYYQLLEQGVFPPPIYHIKSKRPLYTHELRNKCLEIKESGIGFNGDFILFYDKKNNNESFSKYKPNFEYNKRAYNKEDKKEIWKNLNYIIFNNNNNCFSSVDKYYNKIIFINNLWNSLFNNLNFIPEYKKWMREEGITKKQIKNIELKTNLNIDGQYYNQGIEFHHLLKVDCQEANAINFPINDTRIGIPLFKKDHIKLNNKNIKRQIKIMERNDWFDLKSDDCRRRNKYEFKKYLIDSIIDIEKEYNINKNFSKYIKKQLVTI